MAPLTPTWTQPSHPKIQKVIYGTNASQEFTSKSESTLALPPFAVYAKMDFPPCTYAEKATYATVQCGKGKHLNLNSDLVYVNHSCEPSVIFETSTLTILAGPLGLLPGQELTFFYPSTEWDMAQGFQCLCGTKSCKGLITGAKDMSNESLEGYYLNGHIRELLEEKDSLVVSGNGNGVLNGVNGKGQAGPNGVGKEGNGDVVSEIDTSGLEGETRRGVTSREMSGEMGGDTK